MTSERTAYVLVLLPIATLCVAVPASAQSPLSLSAAIRRAGTQNPDVGTAAAAEREAAERVTASVNLITATVALQRATGRS